MTVIGAGRIGSALVDMGTADDVGGCYAWWEEGRLSESKTSLMHLHRPWHPGPREAGRARASGCPRAHCGGHPQ